MKYILPLCVAMVILSTSTSAQVVCTPRVDMITHLAKKYGEVPVALGVTTFGGLVEVLTTDDGGTWTIILTNPNGTSCWVASGEGWRMKEFDDAKLKPQT